MRVRIGIADTPREVELDIDDADAFVTMLEAAHSNSEAFVWVDAADGKRVGIPVSRLGFVEIEVEHRVDVGFRT
ncbi:MAG: DUF3107 family protein [Gammaproteobacteria bacterium]|nr:DUF3107 family protein [Gammaproteobacteria bacterium]